MKKQRLQLLGLITAFGFWVAGCTSSHTTLIREPATSYYPRGEQILAYSPPEPNRRVEGQIPERTYVWVPGYWAEANQNWVWIAGHRESLPAH